MNVRLPGFDPAERIRPFGSPKLDVPANLPGPFTPEIYQVSTGFTIDTND